MTRTRAIASEAVWHDVECGGYEGDLPLFERLAATADGTVLELGCGTGRVTLHLARRGHDITALDHNAELLATLEGRASARGLQVEAVQADTRSFDLRPSAFDLILAPMQLTQQLGGSAGRLQMLERAAAHLGPQGRLALAIVEGEPQTGGATPLPDVRELDGWVFSSFPLDVRSENGGVVVERLRQAVSPTGDLEEERHDERLDVIDADLLAGEAGGIGLRVAEREYLPATTAHIGSTVMVMEVAGA